MSIDELIEDTLNPFNFIKVVIHSSKELVESLQGTIQVEDNPASSQPYVFEMIEVDDFNCYIFARKKRVDAFIEVMKGIDLEWSIHDTTHEFWNMTDDEIEKIINSDKKDLEEDRELVENFYIGIPYKKDRILEIIKTNFLTIYSVDDVLDKISKYGKESLNQVNRFILDSNKK